MKFVLRCFAAIVLASTTFGCAAPTEDPADGADQQDRVQVAPGHGSSEPSIQPQAAAPGNTPCTSAQFQVAYDDNWSKRGPDASVTSCSYNASTGYVVYTYVDGLWMP